MTTVTSQNQTYQNLLTLQMNDFEEVQRQSP